jgi:hypothetical protein
MSGVENFIKLKNLWEVNVAEKLVLF